MGLRTDPEKVSAMVNFPQPRNATEVKRFVGMCSWYRRFIPQFSTLMAPITELLKGRKKKQTISWNEAASIAFQKIKEALVSAPILSSPDFTKPFTIQCDASDTGLGGVLTQELDGDERAVAFASRSLTKTERNYSVTERECLAVVFAIDKFRPYIEGTHFTVITDHHSLLWLHRMKDPVGKLARWSVKLQQFSFDLVHRKGKFNVVPDALSRSAVSVDVMDTDGKIILDIDLNKVDDFYKKMRSRILASPESYPQWLVKDNYVYKMIPSKLPLSTNISNWKLLVPRSQRNLIMGRCHDHPTAAHLGVVKTLFRVSDSYYWPQMRKDIYRYVRRCHICNSQKAPNLSRPGFMGREKRVSFPWQYISVDIIGPLPRSSRGHCYIFVVTDLFSKYCLIHPTRQALAKTIVNFLESQVFLTYGAPQVILSDNGRQFLGKEFDALCAEYKVQKMFTPLYHPQSNPVERYNRTICTAVRSYIKDNQKRWDENIQKIAYALRTTVNDTTGYSPAFLNFGRIVPCRGDYYGKFKLGKDETIETVPVEEYGKDLGNLQKIFDDVRKKLALAHKRGEKNYNLRKRDVEFFVGDKVWKKNFVLSSAPNDFSRKLEQRYILCTVRKKFSKLVYGLKNEDGSDAGRWHIKDLKPYQGSDPDLTDSN